jgi:hypothetical protein
MGNPMRPDDRFSLTSPGHHPCARKGHAPQADAASSLLTREGQEALIDLTEGPAVAPFIGVLF